MQPVKTCREEECTPKNRVAKCKCGPRVFQILTIQELHSQTNCSPQMQTHCFHVSSIYCVFSCISSKIAPKQKLSICFRQSKQINRNNTKGRPAHSDKNSRHQCPMKPGPQLTHKKHRFAPDELEHSKMQSRFHFSCVKPENTFTAYITPPQGRSISQTQQCSSSYSGSTCVLVEHQYHRSSQPQKTQPSQNRPRTRINQMISMTRPTSSMASGSGTLVPAPIPFVRTDH